MFTWAVGQGLVERTGKQAKRVAAALASKARNHYKQAISKFRTQVADDREIFTTKIAEIQQNVAAKSVENSKSFTAARINSPPSAARCLKRDSVRNSSGKHSNSNGIGRVGSFA